MTNTLQPEQGIRVKLNKTYLYDPNFIDAQIGKAQEWASKTDGIVQEEGVDIDYSSKAYAIGGTGTTTNNAKYYAGQAASSAATASAAASDSNVVAVGTDLQDANSKIKGVYNNKTNIDAVAGDLTNLNAIADNLTNINAVNNNKTNIDKVAADKGRIDIVADDITNVDAVAININDVIDVAGNETNINKVANISSDVSTVASIPGSIYTVAGNITKVSDVADNESNINTVSSNISDVNNVSGNMSDVNTVSSNISNVNTVASDSANIATVVNNITAINAAPTYAAQAKQWAIGDPSEPTEGSSKYWAERAHVYTEGVLETDRVSNCLTEIPQDIKLELSSGTLTLKSGSNVYYANGTEYQTTSDLSVTGSGIGTKKCLVVVRYGGGELLVKPAENCVSGADATTVDGFAYNTTTNVIAYYNENGTILYSTSFPVAVCSVENNVIVSIDQVFNGFGFIGSSIYALPGIKGLIPNGRNTDGTLKNININNTAIRVTPYTGTGIRYIVMSANGGIGSVYDFYPGVGYYDPDTNYNIRGSGAIVSGNALVGVVSYTSGKIDYIDTKIPFHAVDYYDFEAALNTKANNSEVAKLASNNTFSGSNTFSDSVDLGSSAIVETQSITDYSKKVVNTEFIGNKFVLVNALPDNPVNGTFYFISEP